MKRITMQSALKRNRLDDFISQTEAEGIGPISETEFDATASVLIKTPLSDDQTSGSPQSDGSREK